ncbi:P-loop containing nucleoside triphosphate hydrolase protein, partial [Cunninghamella echinulata]
MIVLIGAHGVGKTTSVYTAAKETGYQVFELHPGIKRSYKNIIRLVGDMSQNHLVRFRHGKMNNKTHSKISSDSSLDDDDDEDINMDDQPSPQPPPPQKNLLTHFFTSNKPPTTKSNSSPIATSENVDDGDIDMDNGGGDSVIDITTIKTAVDIEKKKTPSVLTQFFTSSSTSIRNGQQQDKIEVDDDIDDLMALERLPHGPQQSLILLEEVDILSHDDKGFWNVVMELSKTSKRPIILTCNDPTVIPFESLELQAIVYYEPPLKELLLPFLHLICFIEGFFISKLDLQVFIHLIGPDLRQLLINLEYLCHHPYFKIKYLPKTTTVTIDEQQQIIKEESGLLFKKHMDLLMNMVDNTSILSPPWLHISDNIPDLQVTPLCMQLIYRDYYKNNINNTINNHIHENETHSNNEPITTKITTTPNAEMIDASSSSDLLFSIQSWLNNRSITDFGISMTETRMAE